jgi:Fe-coproporphyrin III synthase
MAMRGEGAFPSRVDIMPTAACNRRCNFCWGPDHGVRDGLDTDQWFVLIASLANLGLTELCCTGGEPLLRDDIGTLMLVARALGLYVTLSTNGQLLPEQTQYITNALKYINAIGIPVNGSGESLQP